MPGLLHSSDERSVELLLPRRVAACEPRHAAWGGAEQSDKP